VGRGPAARRAAGGPAPARRRLRRLAIVAGCALLFALDLARPAERQLSARGLLAGIHLYQRTLSPWMPALGVRCRFTPTCSRYAEAVIRRDGALAGGFLAARRLLRCGPWTPAGTVDPP
jgi:putative membrane protein insertion efficiency factor